MLLLWATGCALQWGWQRIRSLKEEGQRLMRGICVGAPGLRSAARGDEQRWHICLDQASREIKDLCDKNDLVTMGHGTQNA